MRSKRQHHDAVLGELVDQRFRHRCGGGRDHDAIEGSPVGGADKAVAEANRAAKLGAVSFYVRPNPVDGSSIFDDYYLPLWSEVERLGLPISTHDSASSSVPST